MAIFDQVLLTWRLMFDKRVPFYAKLAIILPLLYLISPIDILPDFILGLGQLDDIGVILVGMRMFQSLAPADVVAEHQGKLPDHSDPSDNPDIISGQAKNKR